MLTIWKLVACKNRRVFFYNESNNDEEVKISFNTELIKTKHGYIKVLGMSDFDSL